MEALAAFDEVCVWLAGGGLNSGIERRDDKRGCLLRAAYIEEAYLAYFELEDTC